MIHTHTHTYVQTFFWISLENGIVLERLKRDLLWSGDLFSMQFSIYFKYKKSFNNYVNGIFRMAQIFNLDKFWQMIEVMKWQRESYKRETVDFENCFWRFTNFRAEFLKLLKKKTIILALPFALNFILFNTLYYAILKNLYVPSSAWFREFFLIS